MICPAEAQGRSSSQYWNAARCIRTTMLDGNRATLTGRPYWFNQSSSLKMYFWINSIACGSIPGTAVPARSRPLRMFPTCSRRTSW